MAAADDPGHRCARGQLCSAATRTAEGAWRPASAYQAFCPADRAAIAACLDEMPAAWLRLSAQIGQVSRAAGGGIRRPPGPRMPYSTETDALLRSIEESLVSWEERVRVVNRLAAIDTALSRRRRPGVAVSQAARVLGAHLDALLALLAGPMVRVRADAAVIEELDGADAGLELLELRYRARKILGETRPQRETLDGVPCRTCDELALERADLVPGRESEAPYSRCGACGDQLTRPEYDDWAARYAAWARGADGIKCRRCSLGRHADCCWTPCACALSGHLARAS